MLDANPIDLIKHPISTLFMISPAGFFRLKYYFPAGLSTIPTDFSRRLISTYSHHCHLLMICCIRETFSTLQSTNQTPRFLKLLFSNEKKSSCLGHNQHFHDPQPPSLKLFTTRADLWIICRIQVFKIHVFFSINMVFFDLRLEYV